MASQPVVVELFLGGVWTDITADVYTRDDIPITHGRADESAQPAPATATLTLDNRGGKYNPKNPTSPLFGKIGRNTPIRVKVGTSIRFTGEVASWTPRRAVDDGDAWTVVEAAGVKRRLGQGASPLHSPLRRGLEVAPSVVAYWPCEDDDDATKLASAIPGAPAMQFNGDLDLASFTGFLASKPIPTTDRLWGGEVPGYTATGDIQTRFLMAVPAAGEAESIVCLIRMIGGTVARVDLVVDTAGNLRLRARDSDNGILLETNLISFNVNGKLLRVSIELEQVGADIDLTMKTLELFGPGLQSGHTLAGHTLGRATHVFMNPNGIMDETALGHVSVQSVITELNDLSKELSAWVGETTADRAARLCDEEGVDLTFSVFSLVDHAPMGPQPADTLLNLLTECAITNGGLLVDQADALGLDFRTLGSLYDQNPSLLLDFADGEVAPPLEPLVDDQATRNDVTTKRPSGSSARQVLETGPLSVAAPPAGVGRYDDEVTVNVAGDGFLPNQASWRLHVGTVDEVRYPQVTVDLDASPGLVTLTNSVRPGDLISIESLPPTISHDRAELLVQGYTETIGSHRRVITFNTSPETPFKVGVFGTNPKDSRYDTAGSTLRFAETATDTALSVTTTGAEVGGAVWTTDDAEDGFDINIGGERMTVTDISGFSSPQIFTVVRSVNGVVKSHPAGAPVSLWQPAVYAL